MRIIPYPDTLVKPSEGVHIGGMERTGMGAYVRSHRQARGWTQEDLAARAGVTQPTLSDIERGKNILSSPDIRRRLATALGVSHLDLLVAAGELTPAEAGQGTTPTAERPEVEALCTALRRVEGELSARDVEILKRIVAVYERPVAQPVAQPVLAGTLA